MKRVFWLQTKFQDGARVGVVDRVVMSPTGCAEKLPSLLFNRPFDNPRVTFQNRDGVQTIRREYNGVVVASNRLFTVVELEIENE